MPVPARLADPLNHDVVVRVLEELFRDGRLLSCRGSAFQVCVYSCCRLLAFSFLFSSILRNPLTLQITTVGLVLPPRGGLIPQINLSLLGSKYPMPSRVSGH